VKLYDFHCNHCGKDFEELVREVSDARCPACAASDVEKQLSAFAIGGRSSGGSDIPSGGGGGCAGGFCGGGACGVN
jgi:putative FmdB family regulatory protein